GGQVGGREALPGRGDVQGAQVRAAERGRANLADRQLHDRVEAAVRGVAAQLAAAPDGEPEAALRVQGQAVGYAARDFGEPPPAGQRAGVRVGVERVDSPGVAVRVVEHAAVVGPVQAVGQADAAEQFGYYAAGAEPVQAARKAAVLRHGHRAGPETAPRVRLAVVEPGHRVVDREVAERPQVLA